MTHTTNIQPLARKLLSCALASCLLIGAAPLAYAPSTSATLRGQVDGASEGTRVTTTHTARGFSHSVPVSAALSLGLDW